MARLLQKNNNQIDEGDTKIIKKDNLPLRLKYVSVEYDDIKVISF